MKSSIYSWFAHAQWPQSISLLLAASNPACSPGAISLPQVFGAEILSLHVAQVTGFSKSVSDQYYYHHESIEVEDVDFCNVTVQYTHPGQNDKITVETWLPFRWNNRLQALGGGGYAAGRSNASYEAMAGSVAEGYATITTDAGTSGRAGEWALLSPGNVDLFALQNLASVSLNDLSIIGKQLAKSFYGKSPKYSYWNGCSQGGRQGHMLAQRYPAAFDGIAASAPAINWPHLLTSLAWPQFVTQQLERPPRMCEMAAISAAALQACDGIDGVIDGVIGDPDVCHFSPHTVVGRWFSCSEDGSETQMQISEEAAIVANATWDGARSSEGNSLWHGPRFATNLLISCAAWGAPSQFGTDWVRYFLSRDENFQISNLSHKLYEDLFHSSVQRFTSLIATNDPDLSQFREAGGKMLSYHGLADDFIPYQGTRDYYDAVSEHLPDVQNFYRLFEVPGLGHCGGLGQPNTMFDALKAWVEDGIVPENLPSNFADVNGTRYSRSLCPYPQKLNYDGFGDPKSAKSFLCVDSPIARSSAAKSDL